MHGSAELSSQTGEIIGNYNRDAGIALFVPNAHEASEVDSELGQTPNKQSRNDGAIRVRALGFIKTVIYSAGFQA